MRTLTVLIAISLAGCAEKADPDEKIEKTEAPGWHSSTEGFTQIKYPQIEDNIKHDTLLIQTTFDLKDGTFLMVASHRLFEEMLDAGDRNAGLRLYHYRLGPDSSAQIIARSSSANDSWTMFPTFFTDHRRERSHIILANLGERNSWGQKVIRFNRTGFTDLGFLNVAAIEHQVEELGAELKMRNIAPHTQVRVIENDLFFTFNVDELILFDDLRGVLDQPIKADRVQYHWSETEGMILYIDGDGRFEQQPS